MGGFDIRGKGLLHSQQVMLLPLHLVMQIYCMSMSMVP